MSRLLPVAVANCVDPPDAEPVVDDFWRNPYSNNYNQIQENKFTLNFMISVFSRFFVSLYKYLDFGLLVKQLQGETQSYSFIHFLVISLGRKVPKPTMPKRKAIVDRLLNTNILFLKFIYRLVIYLYIKNRHWTVNWSVLVKTKDFKSNSQHIEVKTNYPELPLLYNWATLVL